jgi:Secretory lipase
MPGLVDKAYACHVLTHTHAQALCHNGSAVEFDGLKGVGHAFIALDAAPAAIAWIAGRFANENPVSTCSR